MAAFSDWISFERASKKGSNSEFLKSLVCHRFILCPPGNGVDTHRMWEVLLAGAIPGVKKSIAMEPFYDLPIPFVEDFSKVTLELLEKSLREIQIPGDSPAMIQESYWAARIHR